MNEWMDGVLGYKPALQSYTGPGKTWASEMNFAMNHTQGAGPIA